MILHEPFPFGIVEGVPFPKPADEPVDGQRKLINRVYRLKDEHVFLGVLPDLLFGQLFVEKMETGKIFSPCKKPEECVQPFGRKGLGSWEFFFYFFLCSLFFLPLADITKRDVLYHPDLLVKDKGAENAGYEKVFCHGIKLSDTIVYEYIIITDKIN